MQALLSVQPAAKRAALSHTNRKMGWMHGSKRVAAQMTGTAWLLTGTAPTTVVVTLVPPPA